MAGENPFTKIFESKNAFQTSSIAGDMPQYSLLSLDVPEGGEDTSMLQLGLGEDTDISEVAPAENSAQRWDRRADDMHQQIESYLGGTAPREKGFFHTYNEVFGAGERGGSGASVAEKEKRPDLGTRQGVADILGLSGNDYLRAFGRIDARARPARGQSNSLTPGLDNFHAMQAESAAGAPLRTASKTPGLDAFHAANPGPTIHSWDKPQVKSLQAGGYYPGNYAI